MIDALNRAFARIYNVIPKQVLEAAFNPMQEDVSLDEVIKEKVLLARVRDDLSVRAGKLKRFMLTLDMCKYTSSPSPYALGVSGSYSTFLVPPEEREHRDIACILQLRFPYSINTSSTGSFYNSCSVKGNSLGNLACAALNAQTGGNVLTNPQGILHPGNIITLDPPAYAFVPWQCTVRLKYDDNFSGMDVTEIAPFTQLCEQAVKAYIYTNLIFDIETNLVYRGMDLGIIKDIVNGYSDANEKYDELIIACGGANVFDPDRLKILLTKMVPSRNG